MLRPEADLVRGRGLVVLALVGTLAACDEGGWEPCTPSAGAVAHPTGSTEVVLRVNVVGGLPLPAPTLEHPPGFTLYGDGRILAGGPDDGIAPTFTETRLTEEGVQRILHRAQEACLAQQDLHLDIPGAFDVPWEVFEITLGGVSHQTWVMGMGMDIDAPDEQSGRRAALTELDAAIFDLGSWLPDGAMSPLADYMPERIVVAFIAAQAPPEDSAPVDWPLDKPMRRGSTETGYLDERCVVLEGSDARAVLGLAGAIDAQALWADSKAVYRVDVRPLLPDESGCEGVA